MDPLAWVKYWREGEVVAAGWDGELLAKAVKDFWKVGAGIGWEICWIGWEICWETGWEASWIGWVGWWDREGW